MGRGGVYPDFWFAVTEESGLRNQTLEKFGGVNRSAELRIEDITCNSVRSSGSALLDPVLDEGKKVYADMQLLDGLKVFATLLQNDRITEFQVVGKIRLNKGVPQGVWIDPIDQSASLLISEPLQFSTWIPRACLQLAHGL